MRCVTGGDLGCRLPCCRPFELEACAWLAARGVRAVEVRARDLREQPELRRAIAAAGLRVVTLQAALDLTADDVVEQTRGQMGLFDDYGQPLMLMAARTEGLTDEQAYARLQSIAEVAGEHGVTLALEIHAGLAANHETLAAALAAIARSNVRVNFDPANIHFYNEGRDPVSELHALRERVCGLHLKDTTGGKGAWDFPALGEGLIDFPAILAELQAVDFSGPCTLEIDGKRDENRTRELVFGRLERSIAYLASLDLLH